MYTAADRKVFLPLLECQPFQTAKTPEFTFTKFSKGLNQAEKLCYLAIFGKKRLRNTDDLKRKHKDENAFLDFKEFKFHVIFPPGVHRVLILCEMLAVN